LCTAEESLNVRLPWYIHKSDIINVSCTVHRAIYLSPIERGIKCASNHQSRSHNECHTDYV
jgi:hypothetical protein